MSLDRLAPLLACPRCRGPVTPFPLSCRAPDCALSKAAFPLVDAWPVLVDFADSILDANEVQSSRGGSPIGARGQGALKRKVLNALFPPNPTTYRCVAELLASLPRENGRTPRVLIVGGGTVGVGGVSTLYERADVDLIGFDIFASSHTQMIADAHRIPLVTGSVDGVVIQAVLEHVAEPWRVVEEIHRVLVPEGIVYAETPFLQHVHEGAYDFVRFTESGHRYLFKRFARLDSGALLGPGVTLAWATSQAVRSLTRSRALGKLTHLGLFWLNYLDRLAGPRFAVDGASAVYFLGRRMEHPIGARDIVSEYRGAGAS